MDLIKKIPDDPGLIDQIEEMLKTRLLHSRPYVRLEPDAYDELYQAGVSLDQIMRALTHALIEKKEEIQILAPGFLERCLRPLPMAVVSIFIAFGALITFITLGRSHYETEIIFLLQFETLLALVGCALALGTYSLLKLILRLVGLR